MMKLVLVRHGESEWNKLNLFTGWMDVDLSDKGREEAKNAGKILKEGGYDFDICRNPVKCISSQYWFCLKKTSRYGLWMSPDI